MTNSSSAVLKFVNSITSGQSKGTVGFLDFLLIVILLIGAIKVLMLLLNTCRLCTKHCCRSKFQKATRLYDLYGVLSDNQSSERSWAVITGGSDGIGFEMALKLAKNNRFNICIISRNEDKMKTKLKEIEEAAPGVKTMYVVADFSVMTKISDY